MMPNVDECLRAVSVDRRIAEIPSIAPARWEFLVVRCWVSVGVIIVLIGVLVDERSASL